MIEEIIKYGKKALVVGALASLAYTGFAETLPQKNNYDAKVDKLVLELVNIKKQREDDIQDKVLKYQVAKFKIKDFVREQNPIVKEDKKFYFRNVPYKIMTKELDKVNQSLKKQFGKQYDFIMKQQNPGIKAFEDLLDTYGVRK